MFDTLDYYLVLTSFTSCLFTLRLTINIKHLYLFYSLLIVTDFLKSQPPILIDYNFVNSKKLFYLICNNSKLCISYVSIISLLTVFRTLLTTNFYSYKSK